MDFKDERENTWGGKEEMQTRENYIKCPMFGIILS